jgi:hypothetical protein
MPNSGAKMLKLPDIMNMMMIMMQSEDLGTVPVP